MIALDGKTLRHSHDHTNGKEAINMVSAWTEKNRLVLEQEKADEKSNEITPIPELLRIMEIDGCFEFIEQDKSKKVGIKINE